MESVLRRFGIKKGEPRESEARLKLQKELFQYNKCCEHGFPNKPSALAYDPKLKILAIGTKTGAVRVFGKAGVEFSGQHENDVSITQLFFLPEQGRLVSLCSDNSLHLWEINTKDELSFLEEVRSYSMENIKLKTISACCATRDNEQILLGTEGGNVHQLAVNTFKLSEQVIYQESLTQNVPDDFKVNPGAVESIKQHPTEAHKFLIGFNRGLVVLWDNKESSAVQTYNASQDASTQLESISWHRDGTQFMSAHADGSYIIWSTSDSTKPKEQATTPYGPFPCKAINKVEWKSAKADSLIAFSGGMPRASYGDRHTVSAMQGGLHVVFDFTSRVVDFVLINAADEFDDIQKSEYDDPSTLVVLVEEELVAIDLTSDGWQPYKAPYLSSLHSSAITCAQHVANVPEALWNKIVDAGEAQSGSHAAKEWPILGGNNLQQDATSRDLLLTGHEDGSVRFWDASTTSVSLLYKMTTANFFGTDFAPADATTIEDEEWPPFRKIGSFDPYSDDPRLGVLKIQMCALSETLVLGGTAGQVIVCQFEREERETEVKVTSVNVVSDRDNFVWKGHEALPVRGGDVKFAPGFQPAAVMQLQPPASCTALAFHAEWQLVAAGTAHGFGVFDYVQRKDVATKCTLNPADLTGTGESAMSRRKSFKKSLRESFRRLRKRKSDRRKKQRSEKKEEDTGKLEEQKTEEKKEGEGEAAAAAAEAAPATPEKTAKTEVVETTDSPRGVERQVESRAHADDTMNSMVRTLYFTDTFLINAQSHTPTLWAGTNAGTIFVYQITVPANDKRETDTVECVLGKEIQLKHRAPVVSVVVIDKNAQPLPAALEVQHELAKAPDMSGSHQVVICSEEQFKIFTLPNLKANNKFKLTAHEGSKVRRVGFVSFRSKSDERYSENDLVCLTNQGELQVFTIPQLRRQLKHECIRKDNVTGINSSVFTQFGEGFYLSSPSEFSRFSLSARSVSKPMAVVEIKEGVRPPPPEPEPEPEPEVEAAKEEEAPAAEAEAPAAAEAGGDGDKAAEGENKPEEGAADGANDSLALADTTVDSANITVDSVKVHLSEQSESSSSTLIQQSSSMTRTVVTKTIVTESSGGDGGTTTEESTTVVQMSSSSDAPTTTVEVSTGGSGDAGAAGAGATNWDDDTKLTKQVTDDEIIESAAEVVDSSEIVADKPAEGESVDTTDNASDPPSTPADPPPTSDSQTTPETAEPPHEVEEELVPNIPNEPPQVKQEAQDEPSQEEQQDTPETVEPSQEDEKQDDQTPAEEELKQEEPKATAPEAAVHVEAEVIIETRSEETEVAPAPEEVSEEQVPVEELPLSPTEDDLPPPPPAMEPPAEDHTPEVENIVSAAPEELIADEEPAAPDAEEALPPPPPPPTEENGKHESPVVEQEIDESPVVEQEIDESPVVEQESVVTNEDSNNTTEEPVEENHSEVNGSEQVTTPVDAQPHEAAPENGASAANGSTEENQNGTHGGEEQPSKDSVKIDCKEVDSVITDTGNGEQVESSVINGANGESASA